MSEGIHKNRTVQRLGRAMLASFICAILVLPSAIAAPPGYTPPEPEELVQPASGYMAEMTELSVFVAGALADYSIHTVESIPPPPDFIGTVEEVPNAEEEAVQKVVDWVLEPDITGPVPPRPLVGAAWNALSPALDLVGTSYWYGVRASNAAQTTATGLAYNAPGFAWTTGVQMTDRTESFLRSYDPIVTRAGDETNENLLYATHQTTPIPPEGKMQEKRLFATNLTFEDTKMQTPGLNASLAEVSVGPDPDDPRMTRIKATIGGRILPSVSVFTLGATDETKTISLLSAPAQKLLIPGAVINVHVSYRFHERTMMCGVQVGPDCIFYLPADDDPAEITGYNSGALVLHVGVRHGDQQVAETREVPFVGEVLGPYA